MLLLTHTPFGPTIITLNDGNHAIVPDIWKIANTFTMTVSVLPVIVDGQTISLADLTSDTLGAETLLSVPFGPTIITLNDGTHAIVPDMMQQDNGILYLISQNLIHIGT